MTPEVIEALKESIRHWRENESVRDAREASIGANYCALCGMFAFGINAAKNNCNGCPVAQRTGHDGDGCADSPYYDARSAYWDWLGTTESTSFIIKWRARESFLLAARDERQFLESLLPEGEQ